MKAVFCVIVVYVISKGVLLSLCHLFVLFFLKFFLPLCLVNKVVE